MLFSLTSRIVSALAAFLYPGYASYKTLSQRPASEQELERWLMYWSVLGCIVGVEYLAEWLISWIPLYTTFKAIFLLYLALPQTQGATYIYQIHLRPFFASHEKQIDVAIAEIRGRVYRFVQEKAKALWTALLGTLAPGADVYSQPAAPVAQPLPSGAAGPTALISSLWTSYGPGIIAGGAALLRQTAATTLPTGPNREKPNAFNTPSNSVLLDSVAERRKQLEAELASLPDPVPFPSANNPARPSVSSSSSSSSSGLRERTASGKFEEIKGGDVEGYDLDEDFVGGFTVDDKGKETKNTSWFGWGSSAPSKGNYQRVKSD